MQGKSGPRRSSRQKNGPHPVDVHVGVRMRLRRNMLGLSQEKLGEALGLTFQQVQKYERGANRIGASRLLEIARVLDVPVAFFYDDVDPVRAPPIPEGFVEATNSGEDHFRSEESIDLVASYYAIRSDTVRRRLFQLVRALWEKDHPAAEPIAAKQRKDAHATKTR